jgi:hypothetical protein
MNDVRTAKFGGPGEFESIHERRMTEIFASKQTSGATQIPMDDVKEFGKLYALLSQRSREHNGCVTALNAPLSRTQRINPQS